LPVKNQFFKKFEFLDPKICLDPKKKISQQITREIFQRFVNKHKVLEEWREIPYSYNEDEIS